MSKNSEGLCSVLIKINTTHTGTLPKRILGYIEILIITVKQPHYRFIDFNTLIFLVVHTYHLDVTEAINVHCQDIKQTSNSFEVKYIVLYEDFMTIINVYNVHFTKKRSTSISTFTMH